METDFANLLYEAITAYMQTAGINQKQFAELAGIQQAGLSRYLKNRTNMTLETVSKVMRLLNGKVSFDNPLLDATAVADVSRDVCWVDAKTVPAGDGQDKPVQENFLAVPIVEEVGAGPGIIPQGELRGWFLVDRYTRCIMHRRDLIAVSIGEHSTSMSPTLRPRDVVLVDRQDLDCATAGRIMLVIDPDGAGMIKRVSATPTGSKDWQLTFYSDNVQGNPPMVFSLREDYGGNWRRAIGGHVVCAWSDMEGR